jgi:hypothetical protein
MPEMTSSFRLYDASDYTLACYSSAICQLNTLLLFFPAAGSSTLAQSSSTPASTQPLLHLSRPLLPQYCSRRACVPCCHSQQPGRQYRILRFLCPSCS